LLSYGIAKYHAPVALPFRAHQRLDRGDPRVSTTKYQ
jgi:hypothetical protein